MSASKPGLHFHHEKGNCIKPHAMPKICNLWKMESVVLLQLSKAQQLSILFVCLAVTCKNVSIIHSILAITPFSDLIYLNWNPGVKANPR